MSFTVLYDEQRWPWTLQVDFMENVPADLPLNLPEMLDDQLFLL